MMRWPLPICIEYIYIYIYIERERERESIKTPLISWSQFPLVAKNQKSKNHFVEAFGGGKNKIPLLNNLKEKRKPRI